MQESGARWSTCHSGESVVQKRRPRAMWAGQRLRQCASGQIDQLYPQRPMSGEYYINFEFRRGTGLTLSLGSLRRGGQFSAEMWGRPKATSILPSTVQRPVLNDKFTPSVTGNGTVLDRRN